MRKQAIPAARALAAPGVYIEEIERGPKPIDGVATSTAAFIGETARGTTKPTIVASYGDHLRLFGGMLDDGKYLPYAVKGFFDNGGWRCYIARVDHQDAQTASVTLGDYVVEAVGQAHACRRARPTRSETPL